MIEYLLASTHAVPGETFITPDGQTNPTAWYLDQAQQDNQFAIARLAEAGIVPHRQLSDPDDGILGIDWEQRADGWHAVPKGSPEERAAAVHAQTIEWLKTDVWPVGAKQRKIVDAQAAIDASDLSPELREAILTLTRT